MEVDLSKVNRSRNFDNFQVKEFFKDINFNNIKNARILEIGCGEGKVLNYLTKNSNYQCFGVDLFDSEIIKKFNFIKADIRNLKLTNFENKRFDFIYSFRVFCYFNDVEKRLLIKKIYEEFLNIGGVALLDVMGDGRGKEFIEYTSDDIHLIKEYSQYEGFEGIEKKYKYYENKEEILENDEYTKEEKNYFMKNLFNKKFTSYTLKITKNKNSIEELLETTQK